MIKVEMIFVESSLSRAVMWRRKKRRCREHFCLLPGACEERLQIKLCLS